MNLEICKKCFELNHNVIQYINILNNFNTEKKTLYIKGLIQISCNCISYKCILNDVELFDNNFIIKDNRFFSSENEQQELLKQIKPNKNCKFYTEHMMNYWNEKENNKNEV